jgi:hypothetical protein
MRFHRNEWYHILFLREINIGYLAHLIVVA